MNSEELIEELVKALLANVQMCGYYDGEKLCPEIGVHMTDDYDASTEYRCDKHQDVDCLNRYYSGEFKASREAIAVLDKYKLWKESNDNKI